MIKLKHLLNEADINKRFSFTQLQDFIKLWHYSKTPLSNEEKNAIQALIDIGFLEKSFWTGELVVTDSKSDYKTTDGKDFNDLKDYKWQLYKTDNPSVPEPEQVKKKKGKFSFNYGDLLFADYEGSAANPDQLKKFLKKWYTKSEINTEDEIEFLSTLRAYTSDNEVGNLEKFFKILAPLKSKFPGILDPTKTKNRKTNFVYRGTFIPVNSISKYKANVTQNYTEYNDPVVLNFKKKFMSFSVDLSVAHEFATEHGDYEERTVKLLKKGLLPAIICIPISDTKLLINPDFTSMFSEYDEIEAETFYLDNTVTTSKILIPKEVINTIKDNVNKIPTQYKSEYQKILS